jgi:hypothetical protein
MTIAIIYVVLSFVIALLGIDRKFGFWGYFFCCIALTPIIGLIVLLGSDRRHKIIDKCPKCPYTLCDKNPNPHFKQ